MSIKTLHVLMASAFVLIGCSINKDVLLRGDSKGYIQVEDENRTPRTFFIVEPYQLHKARKAESLTYLGSEEKYHLFCVWSKVRLSEDEIHSFAVARDQCHVENERTIKDEYESHFTPPLTYRVVKISEGKCIVREIEPKEKSKFE